MEPGFVGAVGSVVERSAYFSLPLSSDICRVRGRRDRKVETVGLLRRETVKVEEAIVS
jgi:hypothetical protein